MSVYTTQSAQVSFEMHSALEKFNEHRNTQKMTTGSADLDSLIDGRGGFFCGISFQMKS
jgi:hypothetical protein